MLCMNEQKKHISNRVIVTLGLSLMHKEYERVSKLTVKISNLSLCIYTDKHKDSPLNTGRDKDTRLG